jgi:ABC-type amino acid transport substrate-binding protein
MQLDDSVGIILAGAANFRRSHEAEQPIRKMRVKEGPMMVRVISIKTGIIFFFTCFLMFCLVAPAVSGGLEDARRRGRLLAGVKTDFPPFGYKDPAGAIQGFDADLARYLGRALFDGEPGVELVPVTSGGRIPLLYSELIDVIIATMTVTEDRQRVLDFSSPYFVTGSMLLTRKDSSIEGVQDLAGKNVAVVEGSVQQKDLPLIAPQARLVPFKGFHEALQALRSRQVDALCQDDVAVLTEAKRNPDVKTAGKSFLPRPYAMAVRKGDRKFLDWLNVQLEKMKTDGTIQQLRRKHFADLDAGFLNP